MIKQPRETIQAPPGLIMDIETDETGKPHFALFDTVKPVPYHRGAGNPNRDILYAQMPRNDAGKCRCCGLTALLSDLSDGECRNCRPLDNGSGGLYIVDGMDNQYQED